MRTAQFVEHIAVYLPDPRAVSNVLDAIHHNTSLP